MPKRPLRLLPVLLLFLAAACPGDTQEESTTRDEGVPNIPADTPGEVNTTPAPAAVPGLDTTPDLADDTAMTSQSTGTP